MHREPEQAHTDYTINDLLKCRNCGKSRNGGTVELGFYGLCTVVFKVGTIGTLGNFVIVEGVGL